jgi:phage shock protein PspC (stress-responsive transcriptional regulator)
MKTAVTVELDGATFVLDEGAYQALRSYLDRAAARLRKHPDRADVIAGLERSIGAKLAEGPGAQGLPLDESDMLAALKQVGRVDGPELGEPGEGSIGSAPRAAAEASAGAPSPGASSAGASSRGTSSPGSGSGPRARAGGGDGSDPRPRTRRLYRLKEGQHVAGVCAGLAAFSDIDVAMIRFLFLVALACTGGVLIVAYVVLAFALPLARTEAEIAEAHGGYAGSLTRE